MWLAMLLVCSAPEAFSCTVVTQSDNLFYSEEACMKEVITGMNIMGTQAFHVNGGCVKIGSTA